MELLTRPTSQRSLLTGMCACVVLVVGMVAAVNLAIPMLAADTPHPSASALVWIVDTYVIFFACLVIPGGAAGDHFGRKGILVAGLLVFAAGSLLSATAHDVPVLLVGRAVTGVGAAAVLPNSLAVLLHAVPAERRNATIAVWASMTGIGGVVGNVGGGAVLTAGSWRWLFVAGVVTSLGLAAFVARVAPVSARHDRRVDPLGTVLLVGASVALLLGIVQGPDAGWASPLVIGGFACAATLFAAWTIVELRAEHPLLDPRLFRIGRLRGACLGMTAVFFGMFALFYVNASFLQYGKGFSVLGTGLGIVPLTVPIIAGGSRVGHVTRRIGYDATIALAFALVGGGLLGLSTCTARTPYPEYALWLVVTGIGVTLALPTLSGAIAGSLPPAQAGVGAGLQATTREFGSALGVAVIGTVVTARFVAALPASVRAEGDPHTVAEALARTGQTREVITAFVTGADAGLRVIGVSVLVLGAALLWRATATATGEGRVMSSVHDFEVTAADGARVSLADYAGKALLIVNVASKCGLTPQYEGLEALYRERRDHGIEVLGFPCNQFMGQEPGTDEEIQDFCKTTYDVTFPVFAKVDVNGPGADPLFAYLREQAPGDFGPAYGEFHSSISQLMPDAQPSDVHWNFTKFLVGRDGRVVRRYEPPVPPSEIAADLDDVL